jgi:hypothetical protein
MTKLELRGEITNYKCEKSNQEFQSSRSSRGAFYFQNNEPSWYNTVNGSDPNTGSSLTFGLLGFAPQEGEGREGRERAYLVVDARRGRRARSMKTRRRAAAPAPASRRRQERKGHEMERAREVNGARKKGRARRRRPGSGRRR